MAVASLLALAFTIIGRGVPKDQELALQWAKRAADQGSPYGRKLLVELRTKYSGTETAKDLYERAGGCSGSSWSWQKIGGGLTRAFLLPTESINLEVLKQEPERLSRLKSEFYFVPVN
jgi:TPR repeat protein